MLKTFFNNRKKEKEREEELPFTKKGVTVTKDTLSIPTILPFDKKKIIIPWNNLLSVSLNHSQIELYYKTEQGKVKRRIIQDNPKLRKAIHKQWKAFLLKSIGKEKMFSGSVVSEPTYRDIFGPPLFWGICLLFFAFYFQPAMEAVLIEENLIVKTSTYWGIYVFTFVFLILTMIPLIYSIKGWKQKKLLQKWHSWKYEDNKLFRQDQRGVWVEQPLSKEDIISCDRIICGREEIPLYTKPYGSLAYGTIVPHLFAVIAQEKGIPLSPVAQIDLWKAAFRFFFLCPLISLVIWFSPLLFWPLPEGYNFPIEQIIAIIMSLSLVFGGLYGVLYYTTNKELAKEFPNFLREVEVLQKQLS